MRHARTCYDHLAGRFGVAVTEALVARDVLRARDGSFELSDGGEVFLAELGVDVAGAPRAASACSRGVPRLERAAAASARARLGAAVADAALGGNGRAGGRTTRALSVSGR